MAFFRDSHQYENIKEVSFSISLDGPEISSGLFGDSAKQYFNIVIDNTNNSHQNDAVPETMIVAYVSVVSEPRTTILPQLDSISSLLRIDDWCFGCSFDHEQTIHECRIKSNF